MFIDVTRYGGMRVMRMAVAAIAYLDVVEAGCAIHLIGGETVRVNEDAAEIEARCAPPTEVPLIDPEKEAAAIDIMEAAGVISPAHAVERRIENITTASAPGRQQHRQGKRR